MSESVRTHAIWYLLAAVVVAGLLLSQFVGLADAKHTPDHNPANKVAVSGSDVQEHAPGEEVTLLSTTMRNAASKALVLQVTLECSILTALETTGNDFASAESTLEVWVEIDGERVEVAAGDDGSVTFCNREYQRETRAWDDEDAVIDDHIATKQAHGFNWVALDPGHGVKTIVVKGNLDTDFVGEANATLTVGNRTLVVEPVDVARHETADN